MDWSTSVSSDELFSRPSLSVCAPSFVSPLQPRFSVSIDADTDYIAQHRAHFHISYAYILLTSYTTNPHRNLLFTSHTHSTYNVCTPYMYSSCLSEFDNGDKLCASH